MGVQGLGFRPERAYYLKLLDMGSSLNVAPFLGPQYSTAPVFLKKKTP